MLDRTEGVFQFCRIGQSANGRSDNIYQFLQFLIILYFVSSSFYYLCTHQDTHVTEKPKIFVFLHLKTNLNNEELC